ncbi:MAG: flagellin [Lachnospiraceae bacterium]|nr:flagellin [Lachnospiraceae bacterium]
MRINYNVSAMIANNALKNNDDLLSSSLQKLSSGFKINNAKDNPAGLAMAKRMNAQIVGTATADDNTMDGISVIETADGALAEVTDMLQRMNELAVQAANGTMNDEDREIIQKEINELKDEINRVSKSTEFNSQPLLDGFYDYKAYTNSVDGPVLPENIKCLTYSKEVPADKYLFSSISWNKDADGNYEVSAAAGNPSLTRFEPLKASLIDDVITITGSQDFSMKIKVNDPSLKDADGNLLAAGTISNLEVEATGIGAMRLQVGSNEGQVLEMAIPAVNLDNMGLTGLDLTTEDNAREAIGRVKSAIDFVNTIRGQLGAYQNRLENTDRRLDITEENMTAAYSRIMDVDMAEEMTNYSTYTVMTQAGTSVLAQANDRPSTVLQLLQ